MDEAPSRKQEMIERFEGYYHNEEHVWGVEPSAGMLEAAPFLVPGRVLDLGAGDGRNTLFLAEKGFHVIAVDLSATAIANLGKYAARANFSDRVRGIVADLETFQIRERYENIISTFTLHFLPSEAFLPALVKIMDATLEGGVNFVEDFTRDGPLYATSRGEYWLQSGELKRLYEAQGWRVAFYDEGTTLTKATDEHGKPYLQGTATIVAVKPS